MSNRFYGDDGGGDDDDDGRSSDADVDVDVDIDIENSSNDATTSTDDDDDEDDEDDVVEAVPVVQGNGDDESEDDDSDEDDDNDDEDNDDDDNEDEDNEEESEDSNSDSDDESSVADAVVLPAAAATTTTTTTTAEPTKITGTEASATNSGQNQKKKIIKLTIRKKARTAAATAKKGDGNSTSTPRSLGSSSSNSTSSGPAATATRTPSTETTSTSASTSTTKTASVSQSSSSTTLASKGMTIAGTSTSTSTKSLSMSSRWKLPLQSKSKSKSKPMSLPMSKPKSMSNKMKLPTQSSRQPFNNERENEHDDNDDDDDDDDDDDNDDDDDDIQTAVVVSSIADDENDDTTTVTAVALPLNQSDDEDEDSDEDADDNISGTIKNGPSSLLTKQKPSKSKIPSLSTIPALSSSLQLHTTHSQPQLNSYSPKKHKPSTATPSLATPKRILLHAGPADALPPGWTIKHYKRTTGLKHTDRYWFSPMLKKKFRSLAQVGRFLEFLKRENGDEAKAWDMFRSSPPGPDEIRSGRIKGSASADGSGGGGSDGGSVCGGSGSGGGGGGGKVGTPFKKGSNGGMRNTSTLKGSSSSSSGSKKRSASGSNGSMSSSAHMSAGYPNGMRSLRIPPIVSPGLYAHPTTSLLQKKEQQMKAQSCDTINGDSGNGGNGSGNSTKQPFGPKIETSAKGYVTPSTIFNHAIFSAGYTREKINEARYKGSSIIRRVDDMFDSSFQLDYNDSDFFPKGLWTEVIEEEGNENGNENASTSEMMDCDGAGNDDGEDTLNKGHVQKKRRLLPQLLIDQINEAQGLCENAGTYKHVMQFEDMIPRSLVKPILGSELAVYKEYYNKIKEREEALAKFEKQKHEIEDINDEYGDQKEEWKFRKEEHERAQRKIAEKAQQALLKRTSNGPSPMKDSAANDSNDKNVKKEEDNQTLVKEDGKKSQDDPNNKKYEDEIKAKLKQAIDSFPPMPPPPVLPAPIKVPPVPIPPQLEQENSTLESSIDDKKKLLISHLDPKCFLPFGRYEGLISNNIADPQFVGPNAPGIMSSSNNGNGLATAYAGSAAVIERLSSSGMTNGTSGNGGSSKRGSTTYKGSTNNSKSKSSNASMASKSKKSGASQSQNTSSSMQLKKLMERGGDDARAMRDSIIRAAVYASRSGTHGGSFIGSTGEMYPEISKAFSNYGNLRPCGRCKNNKQGAYHCRLRRKHQELDFDGGNSADILKALFVMPMEDLLVKPKSDKIVN